MATSSWHGTNSGFTYGASTHRCRVVPRLERAARVKRRYAVDTLDLTDREVITVGSGVEEMTVTVRYDDEPTSLKAMVDWGMDGNSVVFWPNLAGGFSYPGFIVEPAGDQAIIKPDRDRHRSHGEWEATFTMRRTDGGTFDDLLP